MIRGETSHYDVVVEQSARGMIDVAQRHLIPVINGVLTTENHDQALARSGGEKCDKGAECVDAALEMMNTIRRMTAKNPLRS